MKYTILFFLIFFPLACFAQNSVVTDFKENHATALSLYFYPSTLRMINVERNHEFDEMIREIKKARFFKMDSGSVSQNDLISLSEKLMNEGFEEVMFLKNKDLNVRVWGIDKRNPEFVIISRSNEELMLLEISGMINIAKIPKLAENFNENAFLDILNFNRKNN